MPSYPIIGMHYHPPSKGLVLGISTGTLLHLRAEPTNQYDPNAIMVILKVKDIKPDDVLALEEELYKFGTSVEDVQSHEEFLLGYIPRDLAKILKDNQIVTNNEEIQGAFHLNFTGKPMVEIN